MNFPKLISEGNCIAFVIVLPLVEEDSVNQEAGYLIEKMHTSSHWPILVQMNMSDIIHAANTVTYNMSNDDESCNKEMESDSLKWNGMQSPIKKTRDV
jgi:hypothetical protein